MLGRHSNQMSRIGAIACVLGLAVAQAGIAAGAGDVTQKIRKTGTTKKQSTKRPPAPQDSTGHLRLQNPLGHLTLKQPATDIHRAIKERYNKTNEAMQSTRLVPIPILLNRRLADEKNDNKNRQGKRKKNKQKKDKAAK